ncbi:head GIN domain-containing protein [Chitinophaga sp. Hz27]|uniref:head GIN domain-containing protein n=1 Tax=Chitinophaga sp. Hz27 TaxID=3347169 RepID=UPI0035DFBEF0
MKKVLLFCLIALPVMAMAFVNSSCETFHERVKGSGVSKSEDRNVSGFSGISTSGIYDVVLTQGNAESVKLEADDNLLPYIETVVSGKTLQIKSKNGVSIEPKSKITVYVTIKDLKAVSASGASKVTSTGTINGSNLGVELSGATLCKLDVAMSKVEIKASGAARVDLAGTAAAVNVGASGAAIIRADKLSSDNVNVEASGGSNVVVNADKALNAGASGGSSIRYSGAGKANVSTSGGASVSRL